MNVTEPIINAALLGTAAKEFIPNGLPETLEKTSGCCKKKSEDAGRRFYQFSALTFAYSRAGMELLPTGEAITMNEAPDDSLPYFDRNIGDLLIQMVNEQNRYLFIICLPESCPVQQAYSAILSADANLTCLRPQ